MSSARRASSLFWLSPCAVSWGPASVFPVGSSRFGLGGGVGSALVSSGAWASGWAPGLCGPGGVLSDMLVTDCIPSVVGAAVGSAVVPGRYAPLQSLSQCWRLQLWCCGMRQVVLRPCWCIGARGTRRRHAEAELVVG